MAGVVSSTLHVMIKLILKDQELVIHGEGSHFDKQVLVTDEVL